MIFNLRIIRYIDGCEEWNEEVLGKTYCIYYKDSEPGVRGEGEFKKILDKYFAEPQPKGVDDLTHLVQGFVMAENGKLYPFWDTNTVFILNQKGETYRRVYGLPKKR